MEPISAIAGALIAGALAVSKDVGGQALKDAYHGLKKILEDGYAFATSKLLDSAPENEAFHSAVKAEIAGRPEVVKDGKVLAQVEALLKGLASLAEEDSRLAGIDVKRITAERDIIARGGWIRGENFESGRDVVLTAGAERGEDTGKL